MDKELSLFDPEVELANAQESSGKPKAGGTKTEFYVPRQPSTAEIAASRGISEAALLAEFRSSLQPHGERVEDRPPEELTAWLIKFVKTLTRDEIYIRAWEELKSNCDVLLLLRLLYLFTHSGKTDADVFRDAFHFLKVELDKLLPKFSAVSEATSALFADPKLRLLSVLVQAMPKAFAEPIRSIADAELALNIARNWAEQMGSYKTNAHDLHLYAMATSVRATTGEYHFPELATLIEAARIAHDAEAWIQTPRGVLYDEALATHDTMDEGVIKKRVYRYAKRMNLSGPRP